MLQQQRSHANCHPPAQLFGAWTIGDFVGAKRKRRHRIDESVRANHQDSDPADATGTVVVAAQMDDSIDGGGQLAMHGWAWQTC